jgi:tryptophan halogenase
MAHNNRNSSENINNIIKRVVVLGGGSAGFLAAITLKYRLPNLTVTVIRSPGIGIIGVGEATTAALPIHLHGYLKLDVGEFYRLAEPTWKLGIRFLWGKRPYFDYAFRNQLDTQFQILRKGTGYYCDEGPFDYVGIGSGLMTHNAVWLRQPNGVPVITGDFAYHIENVKFVSYLEAVAVRLGVAIEDDTVAEVLQNDVGVAGLRLASGATATADLFVDSSGFASILLGKALGEPFISYRSSLFCDRAVVGSWMRGEEPIKPYTTAETMNAGWCWQIDHEAHINRGYVYAGDFISDAAAEVEFREKNPKVGATRIVKYRSGRFERAWVKNVVAIGNASGFVEPLESTGLGFAICGQSKALAQTLIDCDQQVRPTLVKQYNRNNAGNWDTIRGFLAIHYKFNTRLNTPFWQTCRADTDLACAADMVEYYQENGPSVAWKSMLIEPGNQFPMEAYLSLLLGQQVPYLKTYTPDEQEWAAWRSVRRYIQDKTARGFRTPEALKMIRSPGWVWPADLFKPTDSFSPRAL